MDLMELWKYGVRSFLQKSGIILYFSFFMDSFVIGFAIVEIHQLLSQKKIWCKEFQNFKNGSRATGSLFLKKNRKWYFNFSNK
jgi:hypothetical protein